MDPATIAAVGSAALALAALVLTIAAARQRGKRLRSAVSQANRAADDEARTVAEVRKSLDTVVAGEREAAWTARMLTAVVTGRNALVATLEEELRRAARTAAVSEQQLDELREQLTRLDAELNEACYRSDVEATRFVEIETELVAAGGEINRLRAALAQAEARLAATPLPESPDSTSARLEAALAESLRLRVRVGELEGALAAARRRDSTAGDRAEDRPTVALEDAKRIAAAARAELDRLGAELTRVRADADLRVAAALASLHPAPRPLRPRRPACSSCAMPRFGTWRSVWRPSPQPATPNCAASTNASPPWSGSIWRWRRATGGFPSWKSS